MKQAARIGSGATRAEAEMKARRGVTMMPTGVRRMGEAQLEIRGYPGNIPALDPVRVIHNLWVPHEARRKGEARWLLAYVTVEADRYAAVLLVQPVPYGDPPGIDTEALERFYRQFGFRMIEGTEADPTMVRGPRPVADVAPSAAQ